MNNSESQAQRHEDLDHQSAGANGERGRGVRAIGASARRAEAAIEAHPYFTAGVVAGVALAIGAVLIFAPRRRRSFADVVMGWL
jgi:ElaB/YqjD/DUF883 family membrane-anchored ribosome-binding protein